MHPGAQIELDSEWLERLVAALARPEAYPGDPGEVVPLQSHISCVFLAGDYAYKLKKPIRTPFLDYSTATRRRRLCGREVVLNRRLSPEVYLGVVPVTEDEGTLRVGGAGPALDWLVKMRRLPERDLLSRRLAVDRVSPETARKLGRALARFHAEAADTPRSRRFARPARLADNSAENFEYLASLPEECVDRNSLRAVQEYSRRFLREGDEIIESRILSGRARDGHGDLRAQNIYLWEGCQSGLQILDCIEFNDRFRYGDTAADLAYLLMDLDLLGRADLRWEVLQAYREESGDAVPPDLMRFFQCYRACVRAKIAWMAARETEVPAAQRDAACATAAAALDLAASYALRGAGPLCLAMVGYPGSGKSTLARALAARLPAVLLSTDRLRRGATPTTARLPTRVYGPEDRARVYDALRSAGVEWLRLGENVILDATFLDPREREALQEVSRYAAVRFVVCDPPDAAIRERLRARDPDRSLSDADERVYELLREDHPLPELEPASGVRVGTEESLEAAVRQVLRRL